MNDTTPKIAALVRKQLLSRSGAERVVMGSRMFDVARTIALASFPSGLSEIETKGRLCERLYGNEVNVEAYIEHLTSGFRLFLSFIPEIPHLNMMRRVSPP